MGNLGDITCASTITGFDVVADRYVEGGALVTTGLSNDATMLNATSLTTTGDVESLWKIFLPGGGQGGLLASTMSAYWYQAPNFQYDPVRSPLFYIQPQLTPPEITIPSYTVNASNASVQNMIVSSLNGALIPPNFGLINIPGASFTLAGASGSPQGVVVIATASVPGGVVPNAYYSYDVNIQFSCATPSTSPTPPTYPYSIPFAIRIGGNPAFGYDYDQTYVMWASGGSGVGTIDINLSGITEATGAVNNAIDVVAFNQQTGTGLNINISKATASIQRIL